MGEVKAIAEIVAQVIHEEGVEHAFGVTGYHGEFNVAAGPKLFGLKCHLMRHEQNAAYAADGYAGASRKPVAMWTTIGPGVTNAMSGVAQMKHSQRPCVFFAGYHGPIVNGHWTLQEAQPQELLKSITKEVIQVKDRRTWPYDVRRAFRIAKAAPQGPVAVITDPSLPRPMDVDQLMWWVDREACARVSSPAGDPEEIEKIVSYIINAERPVIIAGDGCYWSEADKELKEFSELLQVPVNGRRTAAGIIPETQTLAVASGWRGRVMGDSDLIILIGLREGCTEGNMYPPGLGVYRRDVNYIQINESPMEVAEFLPTLSMLIASPRLALRQMIACAKERLSGKKLERPAWIESINNHKANYWEHVVKAAAEDKTNPIGGDIFGKEFGAFCNDLGKYILVQDSFSGAAASSAKCLALEPGTALDAAGWSGCGHGLPMAYGAKLARPDLPAIALMGDLGMGISGMEIETFTRENVPVICVVFNNSEFIAGGHEYLYKTGNVLCDNQVTKDYHYEWMYDRLGVHGEYVTEANQLRPALDRAAASGKTAIVNVIVDQYYYHPWASAILLGGYLTFFGPERCKELGFYDDSFWTDIISKNAGAQQILAAGGTLEEAIDGGIKYQVALHEAIGGMFGA
ncbi:MAG: thiamine pyrophosphate-binding protein [Bacillota bacterium]